MKSLHERLIDKATDFGWQRPPWRKVVRAAVAKADIAEEILEVMTLCRLNPDAWRIRVETENWAWPVTAVEFLEVEVTHKMNDIKLEKYRQLWWAFDASDNMHMRLFRMNADGAVFPVLDEWTSLEELIGREGEGEWQD